MTPGDAVRRIGRYAVEGVIGTGAFATVYRAADERLGATVAVKLLADNHCLDPDIRARFLDEGRALRRIDSPHVVKVHDVGETEQLQPFLVLEHADRGTLAQRVAALRAGGWRPSVADVGALAASLAAAVTAVHAADLVHRDLSPGNILLRSDGRTAAGPVAGSGARLIGPGERLLVADLGLSKDLARSSGLTVAGGTEGFRPPEQRRGPNRVDGRADLWAVSAVLVWLLTGRAAGSDDGDGGDGGADGAELDRALADLGLPGALRAPLLTSLDDDPARRHPDAAAWRTAVEQALAPAPIVVPSGPHPAGPAAPADGSPWRRWAVLAGLVLLGLVVGWGVAQLVGGDGGGGDTVTRREDGQVEVTDRAGDARLAIVGPARAEVGDTVTFEATADGVKDWAWIMPDGTVYAGRASVQLTTRSAGTAPVTLTGLTDSGERLEVVHDLELTDP